MLKSVAFYSAFIFLLSLSLGSGSGESHEGEGSRRLTRSIKDALPKDDQFSQARAITDMRHKIFSLENSMKTANSEISELVQQNGNLEFQVAQQSTVLTKLDSEFEALTKVLSSHASTLGDLESLTSPGDNLFALSNQTCGGELVGQSGSIVFSSYNLRLARYPGSCVWTIRANNRAFIKVSSALSSRGAYQYLSQANAFVVELQNRTMNGTTNPNVTVSNDGAAPVIKITKVQRHLPQIFSGPVIFIVFHVGPHTDDYTDVDLHLQFEGMGKLTNKSTHFSHASLMNNSGSFADTQMDTNVDPSNANNFTMDFMTLVISNFSTKVHLQAELQSGACQDGDSFLVITDLLEADSQAVRDCCRKSCEGRNSLINYDNPFIILITKKFQRRLPFNLTWEAETPYPSTSTYTYKCGDVLGGTSGTLLYKPHVSYRNGERCIWVIVPQPRARTSITINVGANGVENTYDHLYMMELTNATGEELPDGPKITRIGRYGTFEARSREVYIVFYSDSTVTGYGFSLTWRSTGTVVKPVRDVTSRFNVLRVDDGFATSSKRKPPVINDAYEVFILTPVVPSAYVFGMELQINQTSPAPNANGDACLNQAITVYTAMDGVLNKSSIDCDQPGQGVIENADGLGMIILDNRLDAIGGPVSMNFSWTEKFGDGNSSYVVIEDNDCGGVIKGSKGMIKYKISQDYLNNERCVWLLHSPNSTSITLKLQKDGFEHCCDNIMVTGIEPGNGTLKNQTYVLNRTNRTRTFQENILVVVFRSDGSTRGRGFALQFTGNGEAPYPPRYRYHVRHHNEPFGNVVYPSSEWEDQDITDGGDTQDIFVIASSLKIGIDEDPFMMPTNISWSGGLFKKEVNSTGDCIYDSITFYTTPQPDEGWLQRERFPGENDTEACPPTVEVPKKDDMSTTIYTAFLVIYKPLSREEEAEGTEVEENERRRMGFSFEKTAGCGGVIVRETGTISYKENGRYSNLEKCVWLVEVPQAKQIRFYLERSGFEECCDLISLYSLDEATGGLEQSSIISQAVGNRTAIVNGPVAVIVFTSDSSVVGDGFRLGFRAESEITSAPPYTYHLEHQNQPTDHNFVNQVEPNQIVIVAYSPEIFQRSATTSLTPTTQLVLNSFRPQIDRDCNSDSLIVFNLLRQSISVASSKFGADLSDMDSVTVGPVVTESGQEDNDHDHDETTTVSSSTSSPRCSPFQDSHYKPCDNILDCGDAPPNNVISLNTTSFLAVYRSGNGTGAGLRFRGFVLTSQAGTRSIY